MMTRSTGTTTECQRETAKFSAKAELTLRGTNEMTLDADQIWTLRRNFRFVFALFKLMCHPSAGRQVALRLE